MHLQQQWCFVATTATRWQKLHSTPDDVKHTTASPKPDQFKRIRGTDSKIANNPTTAAHNLEKPEVR